MRTRGVISMRRTFYSVSFRALSGASPEIEFRECAALLLPPTLLSQQVAAKEIGTKMKQQSIRCLVSPDGWYWLGRKLSKAEVVAMLVGKYGKPPRLISSEEAGNLIATNTAEATFLRKTQSMFTEAGICFNFIDDYLDVKSLPDEAVVELERLKESRNEGYVFLKQAWDLPIVQDSDGGNK